MKTLILTLIAVVISLSSVKAQEEYRIRIDLPGMAKFVEDTGLTTINPGQATQMVLSYCQLILHTDDIYGVVLVNPSEGEYGAETAYVSLCVTESPPTEVYGYICELLPDMKYDRIDGMEIVCKQERFI